jgi:hypothetical protein
MGQHGAKKANSLPENAGDILGEHSRPATNDPEFEDLQNKLHSRQLAEREVLAHRQEAELNRLGLSKELSDRHSRQLAELTENFEEERERYTREYFEAKRLAKEIEERDKHKTSEHGKTLKTPPIDELEVTLPGETSPRKFGMRYENRNVHLYLLDDANAVQLDNPQNVLDFVSAVRDRYYPRQPLRALNWHIRNGWGTSNVEFDDRQPDSLKIDVSNKLAFSYQPGSLNDYRTDQFEEFRPVLKLALVPPPQQTTYYTQATPAGKRYFLRHDVPSSTEDHDVVYIDSQKFCRLLKQSSPEQCPDLTRVNPKSVGDWTDAPQPLLHVSCIPTSLGLAFSISGWADMLNSMRLDNVPRFPVAVRKEEAALLRQLCGASENGQASLYQSSPKPRPIDWTRFGPPSLRKRSMPPPGP